MLDGRRLPTIYQGHPKSIFGKYLFERRFEVQNVRNICCKTSCLSAPPGIFEHLKKRYNCPFFDPYNFRITRLSARRSEQMKNFQGIKICLYLLFKLVLKYILVGCPLSLIENLLSEIKFTKGSLNSLNKTTRRKKKYCHS